MGGVQTSHAGQHDAEVCQTETQNIRLWTLGSRQHHHHQQQQLAQQRLLPPQTLFTPCVNTLTALPPVPPSLKPTPRWVGCFCSPNPNLLQAADEP